jgi:hypothetical protein
MGDHMQVSGYFVCKDIFRWVCLKVGCILNKGKDIPDNMTLIFGFTKGGVRKES